MKRFGKFQVLLALLCVTGLGAGTVRGQATNSGDLRGTVTDPTGALVPGASVTVVNVNTGVTKLLNTNTAGLYDTSSIVVGTYSLTFAKPGFEQFERSAVTVQVGVTTVNAVLTVGANTESVVVNTDVPLLDTESGAQSTTLEAQSMQVLPNVGQDWQNFAILIPGASGTLQGGQGESNPGVEISANGALPYSSVLSDGASTTLSTSGNSDVNVFETVSEVQISDSAFSAQYGVGGIIFNQISKGGTNQFHGSLYDYFQSSQFNAAQYGFGNKEQVPYERRNNFGGSLGGPVRIPKLFNGRDKLFFYFNYDQTVDHGSASNAYNSIPTAAVMAGDFSNQYPIYDPTTQTIAYDSKGNPYPVRQSFQSEYGSNAIPAALQSKVATNFQKWYPTPANHLAGGEFVPGTLNTSDGILNDNFYSSVPASYPERRYFGRLDYNITSNNRVTASVTQRDIPQIAPNGVTVCPIQCGNQDIESYNSQLTDVWSFSSRTINELRLGYTYQGNFFGDQTYGGNYPAALGWQFAKANEIPSFQFITNYPYAWIEASNSQFIYKEHTFDPSDTVTLIRGKHVLHFGGELLFYRDDNTPYDYVNAGTMQFSGQYTQHWSVDASGVASPDSNTGTDYADFLLGDAENWSAGVLPEYGARLKSPQLFVQDDFKVTPNFTLNVGLRYQARDGYNEVHGNEATYDPRVINTATNTPGAFWYGTTAANGRHSLEASNYQTFLPRAGFSWLAHPGMTVRGGFGLYAYDLTLDTYGNGMGTALGSSGNASDQTNGITPVVNIDSTGASLPFTTASTSPTRFNGQSVSYTQYRVPTPEIEQYNLDVQQAIGTNMVFELAYVGSHGFNLNFPVDINEVPYASLGPNDSADVPNPNYQQITGSTNNAISNYNSMQVTVRRRLVKGLSFDFNYVWSHFLDDQDSASWGNHAGRQYYQFNTPAQNYSNSNFDVRNAFKGDAVWEVPVGKGKAFFNHNSLVDGVLGGYQISGTIQLTSGNPFSVYSTANSYAQPGNSGATVFPNATGLSTRPLGGHSIAEWFNPAAFSLPANGTFGDVRRNSIYGPGIELVDLSAGKKFTLHDRIKLQIRADATNAFNHPSFGIPSEQLTASGGAGSIYASNGTNGQITSIDIGGRTMQFGARLEF